MVNEIRKLVRPFITFCFVGATIYLYVTGKLSAKSILQITGIIIGFYFGERSALKGTANKDD